MDNEREELRRTRTWSDKLRRESSAAPAGDPNLERFQKQSAEFNARVHQALAEVPVPRELREQILARSKIIQVPAWRRRGGLLAVAASLVLLGTLATLWFRPKSGEDLSYAGFRSRMVAFALRQYSMDIHTNELAAVREYLARTGAPAQFGLPPSLAQRPVVGGARLSWQGKPVGMVCFAAPGGQTLYMFVIDSADAGKSVEETDVSREKSLATATWSSGGRTFLLAGNIPLDELEKLVKS